MRLFLQHHDHDIEMPGDEAVYLHNSSKDLHNSSKGNVHVKTCTIVVPESSKSPATTAPEMRKYRAFRRNSTPNLEVETGWRTSGERQRATKHYT